jgi:(2S)-methylsuccinyl-CoA dehydrogenase
MSSPIEVSLTSALDDLRQRVAALVVAGEPDAHQIDVDHLVWCHAHAEAARAMRQWADGTRHPLAGELADIMEQQALAMLLGSDQGAAIQLDQRMANLAERLVPLESVGAEEGHRLLRSTLHDFAVREIEPYAQDVHRKNLDVPEHIITGVAQLGLFGMSVPIEYGGAQESSDVESMLIATEELSRASLACGGSLITRPEILVRALLRGGTEEQKRLWLPAIAAGEKMVAVAVTEPDCGSDLAALKCRATRLPDGNWEISGTKLWCTFAGRSELLMVLCRTADAGHRGLSLFVVEKPAFVGHDFEYMQPGGGSVRGRAIPTIGYRGMHTFDLAFDRFRVPAIALIGGEEWLNRGFYMQVDGFVMGRIQTAGRAVGLMQAALDSAVSYAKQRVVFGKPIFEYPLIRFKIGAMALRVHSSRQLAYRAARLLNQGQGETDASTAKLYASRMAELVTRESMQVHGAMGYGEETNAARYFVDGRVLPIFEGAEEVLSLRVIGRSLLEPVGERA